VNSAPDAPIWAPVASFADFQGQRQFVCSVGDLRLLLLRVGAGVIAVQDACTHLGESLYGGRLMGGYITCPFHGACFNVATGEAVSGPAVAPLRRLRVQIDGDQIFVEVRSRANGPLSHS
jgi:nitrite reductase/ring-hydroxylating ferredoxin subunit